MSLSSVIGEIVIRLERITPEIVEIGFVDSGIVRLKAEFCILFLFTRAAFLFDHIVVEVQ
jgi:hypothetical protein